MDTTLSQTFANYMTCVSLSQLKPPFFHVAKANVALERALMDALGAKEGLAVLSRGHSMAWHRGEQWMRRNTTVLQSPSYQLVIGTV